MAVNLEHIHRTIHQVRYSRQIARLADSLMYALNIQHGKTLVPFLAPLRATDNREAVACWLANELESPDIDLSAHCIQVLMPRLRQLLMDIEEGNQ